MSASSWSDEQLELARARLLVWSGLEPDRDFLERVLALAPEAADELRQGWADPLGLREGAAQALTGAAWPEPEALEPIRVAAAARGMPFTPVSERVRLSPEELDETRQALLRHYGLVCAPEVILEVFRGQPDLYAEFQDCQRYLAGDTLLRESFLEALVVARVGRSWPIYADPPQVVDEFHRSLEAAQVPGSFELDSSPEALAERAARKRQRGDLEGAQALVEQALAAAPGHGAVRLQRLLLQRARGEHAAALAALEELQRERPDDPVLLRVQGLLLADLGRRAEAVAALERFLSLAEGVPERVLEQVRAQLEELRGT